jgi:hypothetical protein
MSIEWKRGYHCRSAHLFRRSIRASSAKQSIARIFYGCGLSLWAYCLYGGGCLTYMVATCGHTKSRPRPKFYPSHDSNEQNPTVWIGHLRPPPDDALTKWSDLGVTSLPLPPKSCCRTLARFSIRTNATTSP